MKNTLTSESILDALDGCAYIVGYTGTILSVTARWDDHAWTNSEPGLYCPSASEVLNRDLFSMIAGDTVRQAYRDMHESVIEGRAAISFTFRCDGPKTVRLMRMSISPIYDNNENVISLLYQSQLLSAAQRPPMRLFSAPTLRHDGMEGVEQGDGRPTVSICSFCNDVGWPLGAKGFEADWIEPDEYYARGGKSDVLLSHCICPDCFRRLPRNHHAGTDVAADDRGRRR